MFFVTDRTKRNSCQNV